MIAWKVLRRKKGAAVLTLLVRAPEPASLLSLWWGLIFAIELSAAGRSSPRYQQMDQLRRVRARFGGD